MASRGTQEKRRGSTRKVPIEQFRIDSDRRQKLYQASTTIVISLSVVAIAALMIPLARVIVGSTTTFSVTISIGLNIALAVTGLGGVTAAVHQRNRATQAEQRIDRLTADLQTAASSLKTAERRADELVKDLERTRDEVKRLSDEARRKQHPRD